MNRVEIPIDFHEDSSGKGKGKGKPKDTNTIKWQEISEADLLKKVGGAKPVFDDKITVWKVNPCYVCVGGVCYWANC
jgi:hypothetical protein